MVEEQKETIWNHCWNRNAKRKALELCGSKEEVIKQIQNLLTIDSKGLNISRTIKDITFYVSRWGQISVRK